MRYEAKRAGGGSAPGRQLGMSLLFQAALLAACTGACGALRLEPAEGTPRPQSQKAAAKRERAKNPSRGKPAEGAPRPRSRKERKLTAKEHWAKRWAERPGAAEADAAKADAAKADAENATSGQAPPSREDSTVELAGTNETSRCKYGRFGDGYLTGLQLIDAGRINLNFRNFRHGSDVNRQGLFVYPEASLAMCIIEKNGCSTWSTLFNKLTRKMYNIKTPWYGLVDFHWSPERARRVFADRRSTRIAWVRDPLERFLSGFLNKCGTRTDRYNAEPSTCPFKNRPDQPPGFPLSQAAHWFQVFQERGALDRMVGLLDSHFTPQARHCELNKRLHEYTVIGLMSKANFSQDVECLLERAGIGYANTMGPSRLPYLNRPEDPSLIEATTVNLLKKFFTKDFAYLLLEAYKEDYELFHIERPSWVDEATGELFDRNSSSSPMLSLMRGRFAGDEAAAEEHDEDEDDLVKLAARAGYVRPRELSR